MKEVDSDMDRNVIIELHKMVRIGHSEKHKVNMFLVLVLTTRIQMECYIAEMKWVKYT